MKIGYCTWGMAQVPVRVFVPFLARLGYRGLELVVIPGYTTELISMDSSERRRIARMLYDHQLELPAIAAQTSIIDLEPEVAARHHKYLTDAIDLAVEWAQDAGPPAVDTTVGGKPDDWDSKRELLFERMGALVRYAEQRGVVIAAKPHIDSMLNTSARTLELLQAINSPCLKLNLDISHFHVQGMSIDESVAVLAPHTVHTHIKDKRGVAPDFEFVIPGEGELDYVHYLRAMRAAGYDDYITAKISNTVQQRPNYDPLQVASQTYRVLARAFEEAGEVL